MPTETTIKREDDPDETEGRRLYRARANGIVRTQTALAERRVRLVETESDAQQS